jgi:hypothetical protein
VLLAVLIAHLLQGGGQPGKLSADTGSAPSSFSPSASRNSPSPSLGPAIPAGFAGTWSGQVTQPPTDTYNVTVTFAAGQQAGTISYTGSDFTCSGDLNLTAVSGTKMTMSQDIIVGQKTCGNGTVSISASGPNSVIFDFESNPVASGTLTRK